MKINFARHEYDTERTKNRGGRSRRQLFRPFWGSSLWRNEQRGSDVKFPHILVLPMFLRLVLSILNFLCKTWTSHLDSCLLGDTWRDSVSVWVHDRALKPSAREFYGRASLFVAPYWRAPRKAKQLSTAKTPLCFWFFRCRIHVL